MNTSIVPQSPVKKTLHIASYAAARQAAADLNAAMTVGEMKVVADVSFIKTGDGEFAICNAQTVFPARYNAKGFGETFIWAKRKVWNVALAA